MSLWNPLKLLFLIAVPFNCKMMQFLLIGFHSVGKALKFFFLLFFFQMVPFFQVWSIKQILALFLFYASAYYRANWINNAAIIVWVCWYGCQSVVCMCVIKKKFVCVLVKFEREKLYCKSHIQPLCAPAEFCWHLMGKIWYCAQTKSYWKLIFWDINLKFGTQLV